MAWENYEFIHKNKMSCSIWLYANEALKKRYVYCISYINMQSCLLEYLIPSLSIFICYILKLSLMSRLVCEGKAFTFYLYLLLFPSTFIFVAAHLCKFLSMSVFRKKLISLLIYQYLFLVLKSVSTSENVRTCRQKWLLEEWKSEVLF